MNNDENFKKAWLGALTEYHGTITDERYIYNDPCAECEEELKITYEKIQALLPKKSRILMNRYDALKNEVFGVEADEIYLNGLKDAIKILSVLGVL